MNWPDDFMNKIICGDCLDVMREMPDSSVHCCVTSPPYWGLRDYGCDGQVGLEPTPEEYTAKMVEIFREVRRVLRDDGTLWLNLGDSYAGGGGFCSTAPSTAISKSGKYGTAGASMKSVGKVVGLKSKDLVGIPWRVAFALQADGWYLRSDIIWHKPSSMPESVTDRPTKAHEYIFLLSKNERYYYDGDSIAERSSYPGKNRKCGVDAKYAWTPTMKARALQFYTTEDTRNKRTVWTVPTHPYPEAHFATFPPDLIKPCIKAGCPEEGIVLDPFMGSGTTAEVCCNLNRQFIGIELNPEYCKLAETRIAKATAQMRLFHG